MKKLILPMTMIVTLAAIPTAMRGMQEQFRKITERIKEQINAKKYAEILEESRPFFEEELKIDLALLKANADATAIEAAILDEYDITRKTATDLLVFNEAVMQAIDKVGKMIRKKQKSADSIFTGKKTDARLFGEIAKLEAAIQEVINKLLELNKKFPDILKKEQPK